MLQAVIIAGGLATRLRPLTEKIPKSLVEINGEPFVLHQLRLLKQKGIDRVLLCLGYLGEQVVELLGAEKFGISLTYSFEEKDRLLGTAGCLKHALALLEENFFVLYGDSYLPCDYVAVEASFFKQRKPALMTVFQNNGLWDSSNVELKNGKIVRYSKTARDGHMHHIDYGLGVFNRNAIEERFFVSPLEGDADFFKQSAEKIREGAVQQPLDLALVYQNLLKNGDLAAFEVHERFYEVGSFAGIQELSSYLFI